MSEVFLEIGTDDNLVYTDMGGSPAILDRLCNSLSDDNANIRSVDIALYLFNNYKLLSTLMDLAKNGCTVNVYSIPLEGYDNENGADIYSYINNTLLGKYTKYELARKVYDEIRAFKNPNFHFYIMPHMYIRSSRLKAFSRGKMPYSLHCKTWLIQYRNNAMVLGITSSNLAVRDAPKIELEFTTLLNTRTEAANAIRFYRHMIQNSIELREFNEDGGYTNYRITECMVPERSRLSYVAPFYCDSPTLFEDRLMQMINHAERRVIIVAQHISAYMDTERDNILTCALNKARNGVHTLFISQTYADANDDEGRRGDYRVPQNTKSFVEFVEMAKKTANCVYYVNKNLHAKYMLIDNILIVTTSNFTPSQFTYRRQVNIQKFENIPGLSYSGTYSEFIAYYVSEDPKCVSQMEVYTKEILNLESTKRMFGY